MATILDGKSLAANVPRNKLVMCSVARRLTLKHLLRLRLTCTAWNEAFLVEIKKMGQVSLNRMELERTGGCTVRYEDYNLLTDYTSLMKSSSQIPFCNYKIYDLSYRNLYHTKHIEEFFRVCGQSIKSLWLEQPRGGPINVEMMRLVIFKLTPELEALHLMCANTMNRDRPQPEWRTGVAGVDGGSNSCCTLTKLQLLEFDSCGTVHHQAYDLLIDLICNSPNLNYLDVSLMSQVVHGNRHSNLDVLNALRESHADMNRFNTLMLSPHTSLTISELELLVNWSRSQRADCLKLSAFRGYIKYRDLPEGFIRTNGLLHSFLISQVPTLRNLRLNICARTLQRNEREIWIQMPRMDNLTTLNWLLEVNSATQPVHVLYEGGGGSLMDTFPSLCNFQCRDSKPLRLPGFEPVIGKGEGDVAGQPEKHQGVTKLLLQNLMLTEHSTKLQVLFPSVTCVELRVSQRSSQIMLDQIKILWTLYPTLQHIHVLHEYLCDSRVKGSIDLDQVLSGLLMSALDSVAHDLGLHNAVVQDEVQEAQATPLPITLAKISESIRKYKTEPAISDLRQLRTFKLQCKGGYTFKLGDIGAYLGLTCVSATVEEIVIEWAPGNSGPTRKYQSQVTDTCVNFIRETLGRMVAIDI